jgi:hypothetical protein
MRTVIHYRKPPQIDIGFFRAGVWCLPVGAVRGGAPVVDKTRGLQPHVAVAPLEPDRPDLASRMGRLKGASLRRRALPSGDVSGLTG